MFAPPVESETPVAARRYTEWRRPVLKLARMPFQPAIPALSAGQSHGRGIDNPAEKLLAGLARPSGL
jgi:hypothetical protein